MDVHHRHAGPFPRGLHVSVCAPLLRLPQLGPLPAHHPPEPGAQRKPLVGCSLRFSLVILRCAHSARCLLCRRQNGKPWLTWSRAVDSTFPLFARGAELNFANGRLPASGLRVSDQLLDAAERDVGRQGASAHILCSSCLQPWLTLALVLLLAAARTGDSPVVPVPADVGASVGHVCRHLQRQRKLRLGPATVHLPGSDCLSCSRLFRFHSSAHSSAHW